MATGVVAELVAFGSSGPPARDLSRSHLAADQEEGSFEAGGIECRNRDIELRGERIVIAQHHGRPLATWPGAGKGLGSHHGDGQQHRSESHRCPPRYAIICAVVLSLASTGDRVGRQTGSSQASSLYWMTGLWTVRGNEVVRLHLVMVRQQSPAPT